MGKVPEFKIRASATGKICGVKGLGDTGKNYVKDWVKSHLYGYRREFSSKYTEKGLLCEDESINLVADYYNLGFLAKNVERKNNPWAEGECDIATKNAIHDVKNSWDCYSFPIWDTEPKNTDYVWQGQTYLWLWDKEDYFLHYTLNDAPEKLITQAYWKAHKDFEIEGDTVNDDLYEQVRSKMVHSHLPEPLRIKTFTFKRDEAKIEIIKNRVLECRTFITTLK